MNLSTNVKLGSKAIFRGSVLYGEGVQNYMNDAPVDVGIKDNGGVGPAEGVALPVTGVSAFLDINWSERFSSALGYSFIDIDNSNAQEASAFKKGQYAIGNVMYYPVKNTMMGIEFQWGDRENFADDFNPSIFKIQFSAKYNFSEAFYKKRD